MLGEPRYMYVSRVMSLMCFHLVYLFKCIISIAPRSYFSNRGGLRKKGMSVNIKSLVYFNPKPNYFGYLNMVRFH